MAHPEHCILRARRTGLHLLIAWLLAEFGAAGPAAATSRAHASVVLVVDTSVSMTEAGMDPERTSLLVARLFADIVPGELAVVRLPDLVGDSDLLPSHPAGERVPCPDDPSLSCEVVEPSGDWEAIARSARLGVLRRPRRGDPGYKRSLEEHLEPRATDSKFLLAFRAAQGSLESFGGGQETVRSVLWLSDGRPDDGPALRRVLAELRSEGTRVEAIVFGRGDTESAREAGIEVRQAASPAELMATFADVFRRVVEAPYRLDGLLRDHSSFEMQPHVDEAWVIVHGDSTLSEVSLHGPSGTHPADHGDDRHPPAGAYRVAYLERPAPGKWRIDAQGGGHETAFAVIQRSSLDPVLLEPAEALAGVETTLVAGIRGGVGGELVSAQEVLEAARLTAEIAGRSLTLARGGTGDVESASQGRFSASVRFETPGKVPVRLRLLTDLIDRAVETQVEVTGLFRYSGGPVTIDLGRLRAGEEACRALTFEAEQRGSMPFQLTALREPPRGHLFELRGPELASPLVANGQRSPLAPAQDLRLCLVTARSAPSSEGGGSPWLALAVAGSEAASHRVPLAVAWDVKGLSFWERWWKLFFGLLAVLVVLLLAGGYVLPHRFPPAFAVTFVPEREELEEHGAQPVRQWQGVGIGFYRNARAYLHSDFRLSGRPRGALASLHAEGRAARVAPGRGSTLYRETLDGDWESVPPAGRTGRAGDVYRVGDGGPYFSLRSRR